MIILFSILIPILLIFSGFAKAICDLSEEGKLKFKADFWHKNIAWKNKWKNGDKSQGEKFFGSSRWFVLFTDAWHLFGLLFRVSFIVAYTSIGLFAPKDVSHIFSEYILSEEYQQFSFAEGKFEVQEVTSLDLSKYCINNSTSQLDLSIILGSLFNSKFVNL
jgi:hypothetical protein